jgi:hypothetical protein
MLDRQPLDDAPTAGRGRRPVLALLGALVCLSASYLPLLAAQSETGLSGTWTIDRAASQFPREVGFGADFVPRPDRGQRAPAGAPGAPPAPALRPQGESYDDAQRRQRLTDEVRTPPERLTVVDTPVSVTITDEKGKSRTFHPDGRAETLQLDSTPVLMTARRESESLVVLYAVADLRQIRYTYSRPNPGQLVVDVQFIERGVGGDTVRRMYTVAPPAGSTGTAASGAQPGGTAAAPPAGTPPKPVVPRAGSEFAGLARLGLVVEELGSQATGCGLTRDALERSVAKHFTDVGLRIVRDADEDTYVYVNIMTSTLSSGMCISRWDWSIYSTTEATLSYQRSPLLAQVMLAHKGGLAGSMPATHAADVMRGMDDGFDQIAAIIRDANK